MVFTVCVEASLLNYLFLFFQLLLDRDVAIQIECVGKSMWPLIPPCKEIVHFFFFFNCKNILNMYINKDHVGENE